MSIHFTDNELRRIIETKTVGDFYPYNLKEYDAQAVDDYISKAVGSLTRIKNIKYEADFESYGSGYASYVNVFCWKRDGSSSEERNDECWIDGIRIYINRLAPIAVIGEGQITKHVNGGSSDFIESQTVGSLPPGDWQEQVDGIKNILERYHFEIVDRNYVSQPLPFKANIPTILSDPPYTIFDALFYWED